MHQWHAKCKSDIIVKKKQQKPVLHVQKRYKYLNLGEHWRSLNNYYSCPLVMNPLTYSIFLIGCCVNSQPK